MPTIYCRHIKTNGRRCLSPAMHGRTMCYFHVKAHAGHRCAHQPCRDEMATQAVEDAGAGELILHPTTVDPGQLQRDPIVAEYFGLAPLTPANATLSLPTLEDRESIQLALSVALQALAQNRIDAKRAYTLLFGLQVASRNAQHLNLDSDRVVVSTIEDEEGHELAPAEDPIEIQQRDAILAELQQNDDGGDDDEDFEDDDETIG